MDVIKSSMDILNKRKQILKSNFTRDKRFINKIKEKSQNENFVKALDEWKFIANGSMVNHSTPLTLL